MYFVYSLQPYSPKNRAWRELLEYVKQYEYVLIKDEISLDALIEELRMKVSEINTKYPKLKQIRFSSGKMAVGVQQIDASTDSMGCPDMIFFMNICRVHSVYQFSEKVTTPKKEISTPGICRICGCTENDPCFHPDYNTCWWADDEHTLCSHCAAPEIKDDPRTEHCINSKGKRCNE